MEEVIGGVGDWCGNAPPGGDGGAFWGFWGGGGWWGVLGFEVDDLVEAFGAEEGVEG
jgi:hypothetical protein